MITQSRDRRKVSSGMRQPHRKKRLFEMASRPALTKMGERKTAQKRARGGSSKARLLRINLVNLYDPKTRSFKKAAIKTVVGNPANRHYARANIMTKGAILETEFGKARITSRPGQEGAINATLLPA